MFSQSTAEREFIMHTQELMQVAAMQVRKEAGVGRVLVLVLLGWLRVG